MLLLRNVQRRSGRTAARPARASCQPQLPRLLTHVDASVRTTHLLQPSVFATTLRSHQQHRLLWGRASDLLSWIGLKSDTNVDATITTTTTDDASAAAAATKATAQTQPDAAAAPSTLNRRDKRTVASPQSPQPTMLATDDNSIRIAVDARSVRDVKRASTAFARYVSASAANSAALVALWTHMRSFDPFELLDNSVVAAGSGSSDSSSASDSSDTAIVFQLLPLATFVELTTKLQHLEIGTPGSFIGATQTHDRVLFVSEKTALRQLLLAIASRIKRTDKLTLRHATQLYEKYEHDRQAFMETWQQFENPNEIRTNNHDEIQTENPNETTTIEPSAQSVNTNPNEIRTENPNEIRTQSLPLRTDVDDWTRLSRDGIAAYIAILAALNDFDGIGAFFSDANHRSTCLGSPQTLRYALRACVAGSFDPTVDRGDVANALLIDYKLAFPWLVLDYKAYQLALSASLWSADRKTKTDKQLDDALAVFSSMTTGSLRSSSLKTSGAGYIVYPNVWSTLFNTSVYLKRPDDALSVFQTYKRQQIEPFGHRFTQTLRTACKLNQLDLVVQMVETWVAIENQHANNPNANNPNASKLERECFNKVLWEMLKHEPTLEQLEVVLNAMESRRAAAGAQVIRLLIARVLAFTSEDPLTQLQQLDLLLAQLPHVVRRNGFVNHVILECCLATTRYERASVDVITATLASRDLTFVPLGSVVSVLEMLERQGDWHTLAALGEAIVAAFENQNEESRLPVAVYELWLRSFLCQQQFLKIVELETAKQLTTRFPTSPVLHAIVTDAQNSVDV